MKKPHIAALEKLYEYEVRRALDRTAIGLPFQSTAKVYSELEAQGLAERAEMRVPSRFGAITVRGFELTHAGRLLYCSTCEGTGA